MYVSIYLPIYLTSWLSEIIIANILVQFLTICFCVGVDCFIYIIEIILYVLIFKHN